MDPALSVSVVVCTRNRAASLTDTLHALGQLELPGQTDAEIVVVDNASTDDTRAVVSNFAGKSRIPTQYVYESRPGLSKARNRAITAARGSLLLFTDDDCLPAPNWAASVVRAAGGNLRQVIGGRVELHDPKDAPVTIKRSLAKETLTSVRRLHGFLHGCNMAIGRQVFDEIGRFDVRLGAGTSLASAEDTDIVHRAFKAGIRVSYDPNAVVFHNHGRRSWEDTDGLMRDYKTGMGAIAMKHLRTGDLGPAKLCYWGMLSALRGCVRGKSGASSLVTEGHFLIGATRFMLGAATVGLARTALALKCVPSAARLVRGLPRRLYGMF